MADPDPDPGYVDLGDEDEEGTEEPSIIADVEDSEEEVLTDPNYAIFLSRMAHDDEPREADYECFLAESSSAAEQLGGKRRRIGSQETAAVDGESSQGSQWNPIEIDGLFCPICLEAWTIDGDHYIWFALNLISSVILSISCFSFFLFFSFLAHLD